VSGLIGGDVDQLHHLGDQLRMRQADIDQIVNAVRNALGGTVWQGPARQRFEGEWRSSFEPALARMKEAFDAAGAECKSRAAALHAAMAQ
jgi:uncharacterized protein YukE